MYAAYDTLTPYEPRLYENSADQLEEASTWREELVFFFDVAY